MDWAAAFLLVLGHVENNPILALTQKGFPLKIMLFKRHWILIYPIGKPAARLHQSERHGSHFITHLGWGATTKGMQHQKWGGQCHQCHWENSLSLSGFSAWFCIADKSLMRIFSAPELLSRKHSGAGDSGHEKTTGSVTSPTATLMLWIPENPPWSPDSQHSDCVLQQGCALTLPWLQFPNSSIPRERGRHIFSLKSCLNFLPAPSLGIYLMHLSEHFVCLCFLAFIWGK